MQIYNKGSHNIDKSLIDHSALYVIRILNEKGFITYLVGGSVRDLAKGIKPKDFDVGTMARPSDIRRIFKHSIIVGRRFPIVHVKVGKKIVEVATFRKGGNTSTKLIKRDVLWGVPEDDALRRDFTINALFYDPAKEEIFDYVGGFKDVQNGILRAIGAPINRFKQDPVRMIRLFKFASRGFSIDESALEAIRDCKEHICNSAGTRIFDQLFLAFNSVGNIKFFKSLSQNGLMTSLFPYVYITSAQVSLLEKCLTAVEKSSVGNKVISRSVALSLIFMILYGKDNLISKSCNYYVFSGFVDSILQGSIISVSKKIMKMSYMYLWMFRSLAINRSMKFSEKVFSFINSETLIDFTAFLKIVSKIYPNIPSFYAHLNFLKNKTF
ncbi:MAG: hypothetical protein KAH32_02265 [Chlamydiia bacterium]|nr:hypothetical protein [Chlamydiia bacterium]